MWYDNDDKVVAASGDSRTNNERSPGVLSCNLIWKWKTTMLHPTISINEYTLRHSNMPMEDKHHL